MRAQVASAGCLHEQDVSDGLRTSVLNGNVDAVKFLLRLPSAATTPGMHTARLILAGFSALVQHTESDTRTCLIRVPGATPEQRKVVKRLLHEDQAVTEMQEQMFVLERQERLADAAHREVSDQWETCVSAESTELAKRLQQLKDEAEEKAPTKQPER